LEISGGDKTGRQRLDRKKSLTEDSEGSFKREDWEVPGKYLGIRISSLVAKKNYLHSEL